MWYLRLRPLDAPEEVYTWKKVNQAVVGILTGSPVVDKYQHPFGLTNLVMVLWKSNAILRGITHSLTSPNADGPQTARTKSKATRPTNMSRCGCPSHDLGT